MTLISQIRGTVVTSSNDTTVVDVHGIGYAIRTTTYTTFTPGETVTIWTHLAVRENALELYGFSHEATRDLFVFLLDLPKIGPKSALQILNKASDQIIWECVKENDPKKLARTSGLGAKTAEKVIAGLADRIPSMTPHYDTNAATTETRDDIADALLALGYGERETYQAVTQLRQEQPDILHDQSAAIKAALRLLSGQ
jgi:Holliday junction DNA helicase RuvA